jgi:anti-sigma B factor antagonist
MAIDFSLSDDALDGDCLVVAVRGDLDLFTAPDLKQRLTEAIDAGTTRVVVDLDEATSIDSTTLGVLISAVKRLRLREGDLAVVCSDPAIVRTFEITGLDEVFGVLDTRDEALARLSDGG